MDALLLQLSPSVGRLTLAAEGMSSKSSKIITSSFFGTDRVFTAFRSLREDWGCGCRHEEGDATSGAEDGADFNLLGGGSFPFLALLTVLVALAFLFTYDKECFSLEGTKSSSSSESAIFSLDRRAFPSPGCTEALICVKTCRSSLSFAFVLAL